MPSAAIIGTRGYPSYYGGFETSVRKLAPYLAEAGWDVTVYGRPGLKLDDPGRDPRVVSRVTRGVPSKSFSTLSYGFTAATDAVVRRPDVALVMNCANGYWLPMLKARGIPTLVNVDGIEWERGKWGRAARTVFRTGARLTARYADQLVFDARAVAQHWRSEFGREGVFIPYGGDQSEILPVEPGLEHGGYVLVVARFVEENTIGEFIDAAERLSAKGDVVFVGSSGYGGELEERVSGLAARNPSVHWFGHVKDDRRLYSLWQHAGAYFHGHSVGGTNPALVQAMALGAPILARNTVYNREVLAGTGLLVEPDPAEIVEAAEGYLRSPDLRALMGDNAKARAADVYTWDGVCSAYERALYGLLVGQPVPETALAAPAAAESPVAPFTAEASVLPIMNTTDAAAAESELPQGTEAQ